MPFPAEHAARIRPPQEFDDFRRQNDAFGKGIHAIYGLRGGMDGETVSELQSIRFSKDRFTVEQARAWLAEHKQKFVSFEPASGESREAGGRGIVNDMRILQSDFVRGRQEERDGGLLIHDVKLLATGTWTDSAKKTPFAYTPALLEKSAHNWQSDAVWSRHLGGAPRAITEKIGRVETPRYLDGAVMGDVFLDGSNQASKDTIEMVKRGLANYVSVEHYSQNERSNPKIKAYEADSIHFVGLAVVDKGACSKCRLNADVKEKESVEDERMGEKEVSHNGESGEREGASLALLQARFDASAEQLKTLQAEAGGKDALIKEKDAKIAALEADAAKVAESVKALEEKIKKLETKPVPKTATAPKEERVLEEPAGYRIVIDKATGEIRGA